LTALKALSLAGVHISDSGLAALHGLTALSELDLARTDISPIGLEHLVNLVNLRTLVLDSTFIAGDCLTTLPQLRANRTAVSVVGTLMTRDDAAALNALGMNVKWHDSFRMLGYWTAEPDGFPHPRHLVDPSWEVQSRTRIVHYLKSAQVRESYCGRSPCRFVCGANGCEDRSDGQWLWPDGLAHYVEKHHVRLPNEFVCYMRERRFEPPRTPVSEDRYSSDAFWRAWCRREIRHG
jgi:hypothetical protein